MSNNKFDQALTELKTTLKPFMPFKQGKLLKTFLSQSEDREVFADIILEMAERVKNMPKTYETDGQGTKALAQLHYFVGSYDSYIVEKDMSEEQEQAFGWASFGYGFEAGYISIEELLEVAELDLHFTPKPVSNLIGE